MPYYWKLLSAEILLEDSITQYFFDKIDPTTFLLAWNARRILGDLLKKENKESPWLKYVKENYKNVDIDKMIKHLKLHSNFFKHADWKKDEVKEILCEEWLLEYILWEAIWNYEILKNKITFKMDIYKSYIMYKSYYLYINDFDFEINLKNKIDNITKKFWKIITKKDFYENYLLNKEIWKQ
jgi:hypothetical protein